MRTERAVIFTHFGVRPEEGERTSTAEGAEALIRRVLPFLRSCLRCPNVGLVFAYVDVGTQLTVEHLTSGDDVKFPLDELRMEDRVRNCLKLAVDRAIQELDAAPGASFDRGRAPRFQFIGLPHLLALFRSLHRDNPQLIRDLAGPDRLFTYDSPKFVEAVIRIARGSHAIHAQFPVLRFDEDVEVNEEGVATLLATVRTSMSFPSLFQMFSGGYGSDEAPVEAVNDFAVRVHWLVNRQNMELGRQGRMFLRDLAVIGATQVGNEEPMSAAAQALATATGNRTRPHPQVISGAGLYMSPRCVRFLPPFMSFRSLTTWVDDHLKRRLHEVAGHVEPTALERVPNVYFRQTRHPKGVSNSEIEWAKEKYFPRLLRGVILHSLVCGGNGAGGPLGKQVRAILESDDKGPDSTAEHREAIRTAIIPAANAALQLWATANYADYGTPALQEWANTMQESGALRALLDEFADDANSYVNLVRRWERYVKAIELLNPFVAYWLFRPVEGPSY